MSEYVHTLSYIINKIMITSTVLTSQKLQLNVLVTIMFL